ncbi:MAG: hypoxanthine phosphoribosyltransferase [Bacteroidetes bacterium]|nr:hypoxanthine phosphoribosyltransferase [Bacteroidota bacterium]
MDNIKVKDKEFSIFIKSNEILIRVEQVAQRINIDYKDKNPLFLVVLNGAFMFASDLFKKLTIDCEISFVKLSSYSGTATTEIVKHLIGINEDLKGRNIIVVEDIVDTGITIEHMMEELKKYEPADVKIATLLLKPEKYDKGYAIDYVAIEIPNDFIIGYGLDYDGFARNLPDIYKIV